MFQNSLFPRKESLSLCRGQSPSSRESREVKNQSRTLPKKIDSEYRQAIEKLQLSEGLLRASERKYRSLVESIPDIIFALELDGSFVLYRPAMEKNIRTR